MPSESRRHWLPPLVMGALQVLLVSVPTWLRAHHFGFSNYDFGIYSQGVARLALDPPNPWLSGRQIFLFNDHFDPILFLVAPFARVFPAAEVGLVVEALCALLALLPLAWLAKHGRITNATHWLLTALLALHLGVTQSLGFPFHPTTWAMAPMAWMLAALILERWRTALVALLFLLACKEEFPFVGFALIPFMWTKAPRKWTWTWIALSAAWGFCAFILRPRLVGDVMPYASQPFQGAVSDRFAPHVLAGAGDWLVAFLPLIIWLVAKKKSGDEKGEKEKLSPSPSGRGAGVREHIFLSLTLAPMLGIRFLAMAWRDHYSAVLTSAAVLILAAWIGSELKPRWWLTALTLIIVLINAEPLLKRDFKSVTNEQGWGASHGCEDIDGRSKAIADAVELARKAPGPILVGGNLLPWLAERSDVYAFGGPQGDTVNAVTYLLEQPRCGDTWARALEHRELDAYRARSKPRVIIEDWHVILSTD